MEDWQLLREYAADGSEKAFSALVTRHLGLVYSAALRQVGDSQLAEEVAQAVFILLARKALDLQEHTFLPGWLYRTTRFVAGRALRAEQRRQRREQESLRMQQLSSSDDESWQRLAPVLDEAMHDLGDTDRNTLILRFFQEKSLQNVGSSLGITEEAARKRVNRSVEKLRAFFARRGYSVSAAAVASALAQHGAKAAPADLARAIAAHACAQAHVPMATLPTIIKETVQAWRFARAKLALGISGLAVIVLLPLLMLFRTEPPPAPALRAAAPEPIPAPALAVASPADTVVAPPVPGPKPGQLLLQAVDAETGQGIAGAKVIVLTLGEMGPTDLRTNLVTDANGQLEIAVPTSKTRVVLVIGALADGYEQRCFMAGARGPMPDHYTLKLLRGSRIGGFVRDTSGRPVAGALVQVQFYGRGDSNTREFQIERPGFLADDLSAGMTDASGRWTFGSAPESHGDFWLEVRHPDYPKTSFQTDTDERSMIDVARVKLEDLHKGGAVLILKSGPELSGTVADESGNPVAGAKVVVGRFYDSNNPTGISDRDGAFVVKSVPVGSSYLTATADGFGPERFPVEVTTNMAPVKVQLKAPGLLRLRVLDHAGTPVEGARVVLQGWRGNNSLEWSGLTADDGRLQWASAPRDEMDIYVGKEGFFNSRDNLLTADGAEHSIVLRRQLTVSGEVTDADSKQPIASFKAVPGSSSYAWERNSLASGTNGHYTLTFDEYRLPFLVRFEAEGYEPHVSPPLQQGVTNLTYSAALTRIDPGNSIKGFVLQPDGTPAPDAEVALCTSEKGVSLGRGKFVNASQSLVVPTDAQGHFSFGPEAKVQAVIAVGPQGFVRSSIDGGEGVLTLQLQPWARIEGVLLVKRGSSANQEIVLAVPTGTPYPNLSLEMGAYSTKTDDQGRFVLEPTPPGEFDLFHVPGLGIAFRCQTRVQIKPGATLQVRLGGTGASVTGRFVLTDANQKTDWQKQLQFATLRTKLPPLSIPAGLSREQVAQWQAEFWQSPEGKARARAMRGYPIDVAPDGSFNADGVLPGTYELSGQLYDSPIDPGQPEGLRRAKVIGFLRQDVVVPESKADGNPNPADIDLGAVTVGGL